MNFGFSSEDQRWTVGIYNEIKQNYFVVLIVNIHQSISMRLSSNRKSPAIWNYVQRSTNQEGAVIKQKPQSLERVNFRSQQVLAKEDKHRRIASFAHGKPEARQMTNRLKGSRENGFNLTYRYRESKKSFLNNDSRFLGSRQRTNTHRQTQREKFISDLKSRVLQSQSNSYCQIYEVQDEKQPPRTNRILCLKGAQNHRSRVKSSSSMVDIVIDDKKYLEQDSSYLSVVKLDTAGVASDQNEDLNRSRAKSFAKDFSKIVEDNLIIKKDPSRQYSKTIELNPFEAKSRLHRSLDQIEMIEMTRYSPAKGATAFCPPQIKEGVQQINKEESRELRHHTAHDDSEGSLRPVNTEIYEEEVQQLTNDFFLEWDKMNSNKSELYEKLRNKLVTLYPSMRKKYDQYQLPPQEPPQKKGHQHNRSPALQSSIKISFKNLKSQPSELNYLTVTQLRERSCEDEEAKQKKNLKEIFKQAYFWSKAKRKYFSTKCQKTSPEVQQQKQIKHIQENLTYMNYVTKRDWKKNPMKAKVRGANLLKHQESILQMEKEGSPEQKLLKRCLEDAMQTCAGVN